MSRVLPQCIVQLPGISRLVPEREDPDDERAYGWTALNLRKGERKLANARKRKKKRKANVVLLADRLAVGIDVGRIRHSAVGLNQEGERFARLRCFENNRAGIDRLEAEILRRMGGAEAVLIGMEATGHYWIALHDELKDRGYEVVVLNPIQSNAHIRTIIRKTKTDPLDAEAIAHLLRSGTAQTARIPDEKTLDLRILARRRWNLTDCIGDQKRTAISFMDRLFPEATGILEPFAVSTRALIRDVGLTPAHIAARPEEVRDILKEASRGRIRSTKIEKLIECARTSIAPRKGHTMYETQLRDSLNLIKYQEAQRDRLDKELAQRIKKSSPLFSLNLSVPIVATIHAESDPITDFESAREYSAYCGLEPAVWQSGKREKSEVHISKRGSTYLRRVLYLAALGLYRHTHCLKRCYDNRKPGRHHNDALITVTHKLSRIIWRMLTDDRPYRKTTPKRKGSASPRTKTSASHASQG